MTTAALRKKHTGEPGNAGQFSGALRREAELGVLDNAWTPGVGEVHPTGGYDDIRNGPAGARFYIRNKELYREDGPAVVLGDGTQEWYERPGLLHRDDDLPAVETSDGTLEWRQDGMLHRESGPALIEDGRTAYFEHGQYHRLDGPAVVHGSGRKEYWVDGSRIAVDDPNGVDDPFTTKETRGILLKIYGGAQK